MTPQVLSPTEVIFGTVLLIDTIVIIILVIAMLNLYRIKT